MAGQLICINSNDIVNHVILVIIVDANDTSVPAARNQKLRLVQQSRYLPVPTICREGDCKLFCFMSAMPPDSRDIQLVTQQAQEG